MSNEQATAGHSYRSMAISVYKSYAANTGNKNFKGDPMPKWDELPVGIQTAWEAATRQLIYIAYQDPEIKTFPDEQKWTGWTRP